MPPRKITLEEWLHLSPTQRDEIRREWYHNWNEWSYLLEEAVESFKKEYGKIPELSRVDSAYKNASVEGALNTYVLLEDPFIGVTTCLKNRQLIKELPLEYAYFKVAQEPFGDTGEAYLKAWITILKKLLGWPEDKTIAWAQKHHSDDLKGKSVWFNHELPSYYVTHLLIPEKKLNAFYGSKLVKLLANIESAIDDFNRNVLSPDYDWPAARKRVNDVLREIDEVLP